MLAGSTELKAVQKADRAANDQQRADPVESLEPGYDWDPFGLYFERKE